MTMLDTIDVKWVRSSDEEGEYNDIVLILNGEELKRPFDWAVFAYLFPKFRKHTTEILTCTCGNAGCAGIFYGTTIKTRKHTVEWRDIDCRLPKRFYRFSIESYRAAVEKVIEITKIPNQFYGSEQERINAIQWMQNSYDSEWYTKRLTTIKK